MNRTIGIRMVISFVVIFISFVVYTTITTKKPLEREFYGIVSNIRRIYPSKIVIKFENQSETNYMSNELKEFKNSVKVGDSIAKPLNNKFIFIYKLKDNKFIESRKFIYK